MKTRIYKLTSQERSSIVTAVVERNKRGLTVILELQNGSLIEYRVRSTKNVNVGDLIDPANIEFVISSEGIEIKL